MRLFCRGGCSVSRGLSGFVFRVGGSVWVYPTDTVLMWCQLNYVLVFDSGVIIARAYLTPGEVTTTRGGISSRTDRGEGVERRSPKIKKQLFYFSLSSNKKLFYLLGDKLGDKSDKFHLFCRNFLLYARV